MIIVIPVRNASSNEQLRYTLRAWHAILPSATPVVIGGKPHWYKGMHIPTSQQSGTDSQWRVNFPLAMRAIITANLMDDTESFIWTADDIFPLSKTQRTIPHQSDLSAWPTWCRLSDFDQYIIRWQAKRINDTYTRMFIEGMQSQLDIIRALGIETHGIHNADTHLPHVLRVDRLRKLLQIFDVKFPEHPAGHFRAVYGALWPGTIVRIADPKIVSLATKPSTTAAWVSTCTTSWHGQTGAILRRNFAKPSPYEKKRGER